MLKFGLSAALLIAAATPAFAQSKPAAPKASIPDAVKVAVEQAAQAFATCVNAGVQAVPTSVTPEAGAANVLSGCTTQRQALERAVEAGIAASNLPEDRKAAARERVRNRLAQAQTQIASGIRQSRGAPATPTTTPQGR